MDLILEPTERRPSGAEIVERKGLGHPDSICDALAEAVSRALSAFYRETLGAILHHNVDKALLVGGAAIPAFGGGEVVEPIEIFLAGRAVSRVGTDSIPVCEIAEDAARRWLTDNLRGIDLDRHVRLRCRIRQGSVELRELFRRERSGVTLANDTSCGVGFAPLSSLERLVLAVEHGVNSVAFRDAHPAHGEDVKVMGFRSGGDAAPNLTVARAFIGRHLADREAYEAAKSELAEETQAIAANLGIREVAVTVNAADGESDDEIYLTVTGTSSEAGDDGEVGRGNRINGLITPCRPTSLEAIAGKNPVSHVGKLYNLAATEIANDVVAEFSEVVNAEVCLVSAIGHPIDQPQLVRLAVAMPEPRSAERLRSRFEEIVAAHLAGLATMQERFLSGDVDIC